MLNDHPHTPHHLGEKEVVAGLVPDAVLVLIPSHGLWETEVGGWRACWESGAGGGGGEGGEVLLLPLLLCGEGGAGRGEE